MPFIFAIIWLSCAAAIWYIYHRLFTVIYFGDGCLKEIIGCTLLGVILAAFIIHFWYISILIVVLLLVAVFKKKK